MFLLYRFLINLVCFLSPIIIIFRILKKKEDIKRFKEKFSITNLKRPKGNLIWFHACSVGELKSIVPLIINFEKNKNVNSILITTSTLSSSKVFTKLNFKKTIHQFFPIDSWYLTNKFLDQWKPNKVIFVESEIWPNMLMNIKRRKIPSILLNARITKKTFFRWKKINSFSNKIFQIFDKIFPQSKETKNFLNILGIKNTKIIGNLKYCDNSLTKIKNISFKNKNFFKNKNIICASSTHEGEESLFGKIHSKNKNKINKLLTIIIPRHVDSSQGIKSKLDEMNLKVHMHSSNKRIDKNTDIYLVDTYGETNIFYNLSNIVFLGGSIIDRGGQNPLEPARLGCKILHGPYIYNFKEIYSFLKKIKIATKFTNESSLSQIINNKIVTRSKKKNKLLSNMGNKILKKTIDEINSISNAI